MDNTDFYWDDIWEEEHNMMPDDILLIEDAGCGNLLEDSYSNGSRYDSDDIDSDLDL